MFGDMAVGAGIYEELLFRMAVMGGMHMLLFDVAKMKDRHAWVLALLVSAIVFTVYHPIRDATGALQPDPPCKPQACHDLPAARMQLKIIL